MKAPVPLPPPTSVLLQRFSLKIAEPNSEQCLLWTDSPTRDGYGAFRVAGRMYQAHRLTYFWSYGTDPGELVVDHICHNRSDCKGGTTCPHRLCMNPLHLEAITEAANILRGRAPSAQHAKATHCPKGHPYDEANTLVYDGRRNCKVCKNLQARIRYQQQRASA